MSEKEVLQTLLEAANGKITDLTAEVTNLASKLADAQSRPELEVSEGPMPESNGKSNFTAILQRKGATLFDSAHFTIARSEYPDRVRYEADCVRHIIGELSEWPCILDYDADKHSGYVAPAIAASVVQVAGGDKHPAWSRMVLYTDTIGGNQTCRDDLWAITSAELRELLAAKVSASAADAPSEPMSKGLEWLIQCADEARFNPELATTLRNNVKNGIKSRAADVRDRQPTELPNGWDLVRSGLDIHLKHANGRWCGYSVGLDSPAHRMTYDFLADLLPASSQPTEWNDAIEAAVGHLEQMGESLGDHSAYNNCEMTCCDSTRMRALSDAASAVLALKRPSSQPTDGEVRNG